MKSRTLWLIVCVLAGLMLAGGAAGALPDVPAADVAAGINYQGRLTDAAGAPLNGTYTMRFQIWSTAGGGTQVGQRRSQRHRGQRPVQRGAGSESSRLQRRGLWLRIYVNGEWLTPRQALLPVPYALSLRPGAEITGEPDPAGYVLRVKMTGTHATRAAVWAAMSTGDAVRGTSAGGYGLAGYTDDGYAVYGQDAGRTTARGYGGYFTSQNGIGVYGYSSATPYHTNMHVPGVYGAAPLALACTARARRGCAARAWLGSGCMAGPTAVTPTIRLGCGGLRAAARGSACAAIAPASGPG